MRYDLAKWVQTVHSYARERKQQPSGNTERSAELRGRYLRPIPKGQTILMDILENHARLLLQSSR